MSAIRSMANIFPESLLLERNVEAGLPVVNLCLCSGCFEKIVMNRKRGKPRKHDWVGATDGGVRSAPFNEDVPPKRGEAGFAIEKDIQTGKFKAPCLPKKILK